MSFSFHAARDALMGGLFADTAQADPARLSLALDMLSDWLPYRAFDEGAGLYRNARSKGFVLEVTPLIGADERTGEILGQFFSEGLPPGACLQLLTFASPRIGAVVGEVRSSTSAMSCCGPTSATPRLSDFSIATSPSRVCLSSSLPTLLAAGTPTETITW